MKTCVLSPSVRRHFEGTIRPAAEHTMREHLSDCESCRLLYRRHLLLSRLDPSALSSEERIARGLGFPSNGGLWSGALGLSVAGIAAAACLLILTTRARTDGFASRGQIHEAALRAPRVVVYDVPKKDEEAVPASGTVKSGDELAFAYENGAGKPRLAIFGVDEHGHVFWFHPAWTDEADNPVAISVETDDKSHELPEAIGHHFDGTHLEIRGVFLDEPISVREIEALLKQTPSGPLPIPGALESSTSLELLP